MILESNPKTKHHTHCKLIMKKGDKLSKVQIYTTNYCPYCRAAKSLLDNKGCDYDEINLDSDPDSKYEVMNRLNWKSVPIIMIDGNLIGGYNELADLEKNNELEEVLN